MAENTGKQQKRRTRPLNSSTSSQENKSPQQKKAKNTEEEKDGEDDVLTALNTAEDLSLKLEILTKLSKLNTISESVQQIKITVSNMDRRITVLEESYRSTNKDINDLKECYNFIDKNIKSTESRSKELMDKTATQLKDFTEKSEELEGALKKNTKNQLSN